MSDKVFPKGNWFRNTPENVKAFLEQFPDTKWIDGEPVTAESMAKNGSGARHYGTYHGGLSFGVNTDTVYPGVPEYDFKRQPKEFPEGFWFKSTPDNVRAVIEMYPDTKWKSGADFTEASATRGDYAELGRLYGAPGMGHAFQHGKHAGMGLKEYVFATPKEEPASTEQSDPDTSVRFDLGSFVVWKDEATPAGEYGSPESIKLVRGKVYEVVGEKAYSDRGQHVTLKGDGERYHGAYRFRLATPEEVQCLKGPLWFHKTRSNIEKFLVQHPDAKTIFGKPDIEAVMQWRSTAIGFDGNFVVHDKPEYFMSKGYTMIFDAPRVFPKFHWFRNTPENRKAFSDQFPDTPFSTSDITNIDQANAEWRSPEAMGVSADGRLRFCTIEYYQNNGGYTEYIFDKKPYVFVQNSVAWSECLKQFPSFSSSWFTPSVSGKESEMVSLTDKDKQEIATMVAIKLREPVASTPGVRSIAGSVGGFAWNSTKKTLGYCFAPAGRWFQNLVFLVAVAALGYGGYKSYNFVRSIQLPTVSWPQEVVESSPSDQQQSS